MALSLSVSGERVRESAGSGWVVRLVDENRRPSRLQDDETSLDRDTGGQSVRISALHVDVTRRLHRMVRTTSGEPGAGAARPAPRVDHESRWDYGRPAGPAGKLFDDEHLRCGAAGRRTSSRSTLGRRSSTVSGISCPVTAAGSLGGGLPVGDVRGEGIAGAMAQAKAAAGDRYVLVHGAYTAQRALEAGVLDAAADPPDPGAVRAWPSAVRGVPSRVELEIVRVSTRRRPRTSATASLAEESRRTPGQMQAGGTRLRYRPRGIVAELGADGKHEPRPSLERPFGLRPFTDAGGSLSVCPNALAGATRGFSGWRGALAIRETSRLFVSTAGPVSLSDLTGRSRFAQERCRALLLRRGRRARPPAPAEEVVVGSRIAVADRIQTVAPPLRAAGYLAWLPICP